MTAHTHTHTYRMHNSHLYLIQWEQTIIPQQQNQPAISLQAKPPCYVRRGLPGAVVLLPGCPDLLEWGEPKRFSRCSGFLVENSAFISPAAESHSPGKGASDQRPS